VRRVCPSEGQTNRNQPYRDTFRRPKFSILLGFARFALGFKYLLLHRFLIVSQRASRLVGFSRLKFAVTRSASSSPCVRLFTHVGHRRVYFLTVGTFVGTLCRTRWCSVRDANNSHTASTTKLLTGTKSLTGLLCAIFPLLTPDSRVASPTSNPDSPDQYRACRSTIQKTGRRTNRLPKERAIAPLPIGVHCY
jgi:hypothetical protein